MNTIMVDYDLITPGQQYEKVEKYIKQFSWAKPLMSTWLISTSKTHAQVRDDLLRIIDNNDRLLVTDVTRSAMAWHGMPTDVANWIKQHVGRSPSYR